MNGAKLTQEEFDQLVRDAMTWRAISDDIAMIWRGFENGVFVRSTGADARPDWALRLAPYLVALSALANLARRRDWQFPEVNDPVQDAKPVTRKLTIEATAEAEQGAHISRPGPKTA